MTILTSLDLFIEKELKNRNTFEGKELIGKMEVFYSQETPFKKADWKHVALRLQDKKILTKDEVLRILKEEQTVMELHQNAPQLTSDMDINALAKLSAEAFTLFGCEYNNLSVHTDASNAVVTLSFNSIPDISIEAPTFAEAVIRWNELFLKKLTHESHFDFLRRIRFEILKEEKQKEPIR